MTPGLTIPKHPYRDPWWKQALFFVGLGLGTFGAVLVWTWR